MLHQNQNSIANTSITPSHSSKLLVLISHSPRQRPLDKRHGTSQTGDQSTTGPGQLCQAIQPSVTCHYDLVVSFGLRPRTESKLDTGEPSTVSVTNLVKCLKDASGDGSSAVFQVTRTSTWCWWRSEPLETLPSGRLVWIGQKKSCMHRKLNRTRSNSFNACLVLRLWLCVS